MPKSAMIRARVEPRLKNEVETLLEELGLSATDAITLFYRQVRARRGLPFDVIMPNRVTRNTLRDTDAGHNLVRAKDANDMFRKLGI